LLSYAQTLADNPTRLGGNVYESLARPAVHPSQIACRIVRVHP